MNILFIKMMMKKLKIVNYTLFLSSYMTPLRKQKTGGRKKIDKGKHTINEAA